MDIAKSDGNAAGGGGVGILLDPATSQRDRPALHPVVAAGVHRLERRLIGGAALGAGEDVDQAMADQLRLGAAPQFHRTATDGHDALVGVKRVEGLADRLQHLAQPAFGLAQRLLGRLGAGDVDMNAHHAQRGAGGVALDLGLGGDPAYPLARRDDPVFGGIFARVAEDGVAEIGVDTGAVLGMDAVDPGLVRLVGGLGRQAVNGEVFGGAIVAELPAAQVDLEAADAADALRPRQFALTILVPGRGRPHALAVHADVHGAETRTQGAEDRCMGREKFNPAGQTGEERGMIR